MSKSRVRKPDFIGIGPTKTGTSWLYTVLRQHPEIWLPPVSEVNYFWGTGNRIQSKSWWRNFKQRIKGDIRIRWRRDYVKSRLKYYRQAESRRLKDVLWDIRYIFLPQTPSWYFSLYKGVHKVAGDITGGYFFMDDIAVARLRRYLPDAKIILCFRDPVSRLWSQSRMMLLYLTGRKFEDVSTERFYKSFDRAHARLPDYLQLYQRWNAHFPEQQIKVCYYDDLVNDPEAFIRSICRFLGVSDHITPAMHEAIHRRVFEGPKVPFPDEFRSYLIEKTLPMVQRLAESTDSPYPQRWLTSYQDIRHAAKA